MLYVIVAFFFSPDTEPGFIHSVSQLKSKEMEARTIMHSTFKHPLQNFRKELALIPRHISKPCNFKLPVLQQKY